MDFNEEEDELLEEELEEQSSEGFANEEDANPSSSEQFSDEELLNDQAPAEESSPLEDAKTSRCQKGNFKCFIKKPLVLGSSSTYTCHIFSFNFLYGF